MILQTERILLRRWRREDAAWYVAARDKAIFTWTTERPDLTVAEAEAAIDDVNQNDSVIALAIVDRARDVRVGNVALILNETAKTAEIMYWLASEGRGHGFATETVQLLSNWALAQLDLAEIVLKTRAGNRPSQRVAERAGFEQTNQSDDAAWIWYRLGCGDNGVDN